ncbi:MAG: hypothetical protein B7W97_02150 [Mycobacterium sp. 20-66-4]|nr:MAG: hypothetical protein B7W97_02150 [Mycobacterium sp. 20-66-4]
MLETWREVPGSNGRYEISDLGRVRSLIGREPRIMKPNFHKCGYP